MKNSRKVNSQKVPESTRGGAEAGDVDPLPPPPNIRAVQDNWMLYKCQKRDSGRRRRRKKHEESQDLACSDKRTRLEC